MTIQVDWRPWPDNGGPPDDLVWAFRPDEGVFAAYYIEGDGWYKADSDEEEIPDDEPPTHWAPFPWPSPPVSPTQEDDAPLMGAQPVEGTCADE